MSADILTKLVPVLATIPPLLRETTPVIQSIAAQFADFHQGQLKIQNDISRVLSMIIAINTQLKNVD